MDYKRRRVDLPEFNEYDMKFAGIVASGGVVNITTIDQPEVYHPSFKDWIVLKASGIIIECEYSSDSGKYICTVLAPASLFSRPNDIKRRINVVDAALPNGDFSHCSLLGCDFHYNLAAITFKSMSPLQTVTLKDIDDTFSIDPTHHFPEMLPSQLQSPSHIYNIVPGTEVFSVGLSMNPLGLYTGSGFFSSKCPEGFSCDELYEIKDNIACPDSDGGFALNAFGEVIGIIFNKSSFLPSNVVTRWWNHYKTFKEFRRPFLGIKVDNLYHADINFLAQFVTRFPNISAAVIITKVEEGSLASQCGIRTNDVIMKLDGNLVKSKSQYFETIWEKAGKSVKFNILRVSDGEVWDLNLVIEEANPDKFHNWPGCYAPTDMCCLKKVTLKR